MKQSVVFNSIVQDDPYLGKVIDIEMNLDTKSELSTIKIVPVKGSRYTMYEVAFLMAAEKIIQEKPEFLGMQVSYLGTIIREAFTESMHNLSSQGKHVFQAFIDRKKEDYQRPEPVKKVNISSMIDTIMAESESL